MSKMQKFAKRNRVLLISGATMLVLLLGYSFSGSDAEEEELDTAFVNFGDVENVVPSAGSLQPLNFVDVGAQVSGQLQTLHVEAGDEVSAGDLLAEIDATVQEANVASIRAQLVSLQAQLQNNQAQLELAQIQAQRQERLMMENATSVSELDSARASLSSAQAQLRSTEAEIDQTRSELQGEEARLGYSRIYAPISGTVSSIVAREGQTLNANQSAPLILQIADLSRMMVSTQVSEADVLRLYVGMDAYFTTLGGGNRRWTGKLRQILPTPEIVENVVLYTANFDVENHGGELMTQMTAQVFFVVEAAYDVLRVPVGAVRYEQRDARGSDAPAGDRPGAARASPQPQVSDGGGPGYPATVMVVQANGEILPRDVRIGATDRIYAEVISGLEEDEEVVVYATARVDNGGNNDRGGDRWRRRFGPPMGGLP